MDRLKRCLPLIAMMVFGGCEGPREEVGVTNVLPTAAIVGDGIGTIEVRASTDGPSSASFQFTTDIVGHEGFYVDANSNPGESFLTLEGTYLLTSEHDPAMWDLAGISCSDENSDVDLTGGAVNLDLSPDEVLTCEFMFHQRTGTIRIRKEVASGPAASFGFGWSGGGSGGGGESESVDFYLVDGEVSEVFELVPGTHTFWEVDDDPDWRLMDLACSGDADGESSVSVLDRRVEVDLDADEEVLCVFTNTHRPGTIVIEYESVPGGSSSSLIHPLDGAGTSFTLNDGDSRSFPGVLPGTYRFESDTNNLLSNAYCDDDNSIASVPDGTIDVYLEEGETVTCRFVDQIRIGTVVVRKETIPPGGTGFLFEAPDGGGSSTTTFPLDHGDEWSFDFSEGVHTVAEISVGPLYQLVDVRCEDPDGGTVWNQAEDGDQVDFDLDAGETVICTFVNERATGTVIVRTTSDPAGETGFPYGTDIPGATSFSLDDGQTRTILDVPEGTYRVNQLLKIPFVVSELTCTDPDGGTTSSAPTATAMVDVDRGETIECVFANSHTPPVADPGGPYNGLEGSPITFDGSGSTNPGQSSMSYDWDFGDGSISSDANPTHTYADNGVYTVTLRVTAGTDVSETVSTTATIGNVAPTITSITGPFAPVPVGSPVTIDASFIDPGVNDATWEGEMDWGDGSIGPSSGATASAAALASGTVSATHSYATPGVYAVNATVRDKDGGSDSSLYEFVVVYDPSGGFVTGGGWIDSPPGAFPSDPSLEGRANFGFVSKYKKGANKPDGNTEFQFKAADLNFQSTDYDWLVVAGARAQFKGMGSINGVAGFAFMIKATDGDAQGGDGSDRFRIKIWDAATEVVVYDNQIGADDEAEATTVLGGGSIVVHTKKKKQ